MSVPEEIVVTGRSGGLVRAIYGQQKGDRQGDARNLGKLRG